MVSQEPYGKREEEQLKRELEKGEAQENYDEEDEKELQKEIERQKKRNR